jgi:predicted ATP-dependent endonuclease of OLD family
MRITRIHIENFRCIRNLEVELGDTTVFIGPNNVGKTAILDAVRIVLTRRWGQRARALLSMTFTGQRRAVIPEHCRQS